MTTIEIEGKDIEKFLDLAINKYNLKIKVINNSSTNKKEWSKIDKELKNLKTVDKKAAEELKEIFTLLSKDIKSNDIKTARDEYLVKKYGL